MDPVASSALPNPTSSRVESFATRSPASTFMTLVPVRSSTSFSFHQSSETTSPSSRPCLPARYSFDSAGRK